MKGTHMPKLLHVLRMKARTFFKVCYFLYYGMILPPRLCVSMNIICIRVDDLAEQTAIFDSWVYKKDSEKKRGSLESVDVVRSENSYA